MKILLVEDDIELAEAVGEALADQQNVVKVVYDGEQGWMELKNANYDILLLDVMLPKLNGVSLCQRLRLDGNTIPIIMITALDTSTDKVNGLDAGADDYIVKPIDLPELFARMRALLRRGETLIPPILQWEALTLNPSTYAVTYCQQPIHLTPKEYSCLELFLRNSRRILTRDFIIDHLWSWDDPPCEDTVKAHIKSLRYKLKAAGAPEDFIQTVHRVGYRLKRLS